MELPERTHEALLETIPLVTSLRFEGLWIKVIAYQTRE